MPYDSSLVSMIWEVDKEEEAEFEDRRKWIIIQLIRFSHNSKHYLWTYKLNAMIHTCQRNISSSTILNGTGWSETIKFWRRYKFIIMCKLICMRTHAHLAHTCQRRNAAAISIVWADVYHIILCTPVQRISWKTCMHVLQKRIIKSTGLIGEFVD